MNNNDYISTADIARILGITRQAIQKRLKKQENLRTKEVGTSFLYEIGSLPQEIKDQIKQEQKKAKDKAITKKTGNNHHDLGFEKELWAAADKLRGNIDVSEYKNIVLGLIFLKYISDSFYKRRESLAEMTRDKRNKDFY